MSTNRCSVRQWYQLSEFRHFVRRLVDSFPPSPIAPRWEPSPQAGPPREGAASTGASDRIRHENEHDWNPGAERFQNGSYLSRLCGPARRGSSLVNFTEAVFRFLYPEPGEVSP